MRLLRTNPPPVVVLENVPRLLTLDNGAVHRHVSRSLATLGYLVHYRILNSAEYGAPQSRKRLFYVAVRPGHAFRWPEPVPSDKRRVLEDVLEPTSPKYIARADITATGYMETPRGCIQGAKCLEPRVVTCHCTKQTEG